VSWILGGIGTAVVLLKIEFNADLNEVVHGVISWIVFTAGVAVWSPSFFSLTVEFLLDSYC
jgi:hypothetical protein